jgi:hypothetical protein
MTESLDLPSFSAIQSMLLPFHTVQLSVIQYHQNMSLFEIFCRSHAPACTSTAPIAPNEPVTLISEASEQPPLLRLPPELRSQIYSYVVGSRVVHVRMNWAGIFSPTGYSYSCFSDLQPLLDCSPRDLHSNAVPFHTVWAFEDAFTLDQFVTARGLGCIPVHHKEAIRRVAVAPPGHHQSHEKVLQNLQEVLLISSIRPSSNDGLSAATPRKVIRLRRDTVTNTWLHNE